MQAQRYRFKEWMSECYFPIDYSVLLKIMGSKVGEKTKIYTFNVHRSAIIGNKTEIERGVAIGPEIVIGDKVHLCRNSRLIFNVHLGNSSIVAPNTLLSNLKLGEDSFIEYEVVCTGFGDGKIIIGNHSYIGIRTVLDWSDNIYIGNYVHIAGPSTGIWTHTSVKQALNSQKLIDKTLRVHSPVNIEDSVYIGGNCTIYPGINIGHHSIVTPNSVVTKNIKPFTMVGGVPAKIIKRIPKDYI